MVGAPIMYRGFINSEPRKTLSTNFLLALSDLSFDLRPYQLRQRRKPPDLLPATQTMNRFSHSEKAFPWGLSINGKRRRFHGSINCIIRLQLSGFYSTKLKDTQSTGLCSQFFRFPYLPVCSSIAQAHGL